MTGHGYCLLIEHEGEVLHAYQDSETYWTIGVGHLIDARKGGGIKQQFSRMLLDDDINDATIAANNNFYWFKNLNAVRQDVIVMLIFNMGLAGFKTFKRMIEAIEREDWPLVAWELSNSTWKTQVQKERHDALTGALEKGRWD